MRGEPDPRDHTAASRALVRQGLAGSATEADKLRAELARMEALMIRWRIVAQRWTPGGSEYMDPDFCERFIAERRQEAAQDKVEIARLRKAIRDRAA